MAIALPGIFDSAQTLRSGLSRATALSLALAVLLGQPADSRADSFNLRGSTSWGDNTAPLGWHNDTVGGFGLLPDSDDDANASVACEVSIGSPCSPLYMRWTDPLGGAPISATVQTFDGRGRRLIMDPGSYLWVTHGGQLSGLTMTGARFIPGAAYRDPFPLGPVSILWGGVTVRSEIGGNPLLLDETHVEGSLEFRNGNSQARVTNRGLFIQSGTYGNTTFYNDMDFRNEAGGAVDLRNDSGLASEPTDGNPLAIRFYNEAGATLSKTAGAGESLIEMHVINDGTLSASSGQLTLGGGGIHGDALWETSGDGRIGLDGDHVVQGSVTSNGGVVVGSSGPPSSLTVASGGVLANQGALTQLAPATVAGGGRLENTGNILVQGSGAGLTIDAGGELANQGTAVVEISAPGFLHNRGSVTIDGGWITGSGEYVQSGAAASTMIGTGGTIALGAGSTYRQQDGSTTVRGSLGAETVHFEAGELRGSGTIQASLLQIDPGVVVRPGSSPGLLTIDGSLEATGALFDIEIAGTDPGISFDQIHVSGDSFFENGQVRFSFIDGFLPEVDDRFQWLVADGELYGLETLDFSIWSDAASIDGYLDDSGSLIVSAVSPVPEPALALLVAAGLTITAVRTRRSRRPLRPDSRGL